MTEVVSTENPSGYYRLHGASPAALLKWWDNLDDNRGVRARLRRIEQPDDALFTDGFFQFLGYMPAEWGECYHLYPSAMVAATLAQVTGHRQDHRSFAAQLGAGKNPSATEGQPVMSELRFKQLIQSRTPEEFFRRLLRAVRLLGGSVNLLSLTEGILQWYDEYARGPDRNPVNRLCVQWAQDYYLPTKK